MKKLLNKIDMKQTVEEVAREAAEDCYECHYDDSLEMRLVKEAFRQGAEWQSKQSPWISVKERLPEELESVLVGTNYEGRYYYEVAFVMNGKWVCHNSKPIYWMPIPSFDDILEANRDILERKRERRLNMKVNNVGQLRKIIENLSDDYEIEMRVRRKLTDEEIIELHKKYGRIYPYPYETSYSELEFDDVGVSDKVLCLGVTLNE